MKQQLKMQAGSIAPPMSVEEVKAMLDTTEKGGVRSSIKNCLTVFQHDPLLSGAIAYNLLTDRTDIVKPIGYDRSPSASMTDTDMKYIRLYLEENYDLTSEKKIMDAADLAAHQNRKMVYDAACRALLFDICRKHGLQLEEEPEYGGRKYLEKQDFILAKQKEQLVAQSQTIQEQEAVIQEKEEKLDELTLKLDDVEALIDDVSEIAYDKAVEVVTDTVRVETHKQDIQLVEETKSWLLSPERKAPKKEREYAAARLDNVVSKITKAMQTALSVMKAALTKPEVRKANTQQIKEKARTSIYEMLNRNKAIVAAEDAARKKETHKKQNMER